MEASLFSVLAGIVGQPIIAVPTSRGYGASFGGLASLLSAVNSCANGIAAVTIDSGYLMTVSSGLGASATPIATLTKSGAGTLTLTGASFANSTAVGGGTEDRRG